jgi:glycosyltransferase involved in cell wall biosynthesis
MHKLLTIIIPCKNEERYVKDLFFGLKEQQVGKTQIYLADANSTDNTRVLAESYAFELGLNLKVIEGGLPAKGRNNGAKLAKTPYLLFLDADVTFTHHQAIEEALDSIYSKPIDMVGTTPKYKGELDPRAWLLFRINRIAAWYLSKTHPFAIGGFTLVRTDTFRQLGGYDEKATQAEDWLLSRQVPCRRFKLIPDLMTQDNRRFKKYGYFKMIKLLYNNWINKNNLEYFYLDQKYF